MCKSKAVNKRVGDEGFHRMPANPMKDKLRSLHVRKIVISVTEITFTSFF